MVYTNCNPWKLYLSEILYEFMKGNHVMRHNPGLWKGIWSDMFIESTFMRYGHEAGGLVGLTLQQSAVSRWALSLHVCNQLRSDQHHWKITTSAKWWLHTKKSSLQGSRVMQLTGKSWKPHLQPSSILWIQPVTQQILWILPMVCYLSNVNV